MLLYSASDVSRLATLVCTSHNGMQSLYELVAFCGWRFLESILLHGLCLAHTEALEDTLVCRRRHFCTHFGEPFSDALCKVCCLSSYSKQVDFCTYNAHRANATCARAAALRAGGSM